MVEWPGRCAECRQVISSWNDAGYTGARWVHKTCWREKRRRDPVRGRDLPLLRSPVERSSQLEMPMLLFLLMFHFGLATAVAGWLLLNEGSSTSGGIALAIGLVSPLIGVAGVVINFLRRRDIEVIRQQLETSGGWRGETA